MWLNLAVLLGLLVAANALVTCTPKSCKSSLESVRPVCGSDGFSYPNRCLLELARCYNANIKQDHRGACRKQTTCSDYAKSFSQSTFKPQCKSDGNYMASQCDSKLGYCWCVTSQGVPLPYTLIQYAPNITPPCGRNKKTIRRHSSRSRKSNRACKTEDKAVFNNNLVRIFQTEYNREKSQLLLATGTDMYRIVLEWKFNQMDQDGNGKLDKTEYRDLRRIVKKIVKPKRCAKSFAKACDMNRDQLITQDEWAECLTRDGIDDGKGDDSNMDDDDDDDDEAEGERYHFSSTLLPPDGVLYGGSTRNSSADEDSSERRDDDAIDCLSDRQTALSEMRGDSSYNLYVPECTPDGRYQKIQCYKTTGYCWCVHEDTGKNIPGTSVKNETPKCDQVIAVNRLMKGCPEEKKLSFLRNLMDFLHSRMAKDTNGTSIASANGPSWKASREEQVATWSFVMFDKNKNKMLDKNEWKTFKDTVTAVKSLRRCGKKLPRYCDINKDRQISMTEWLECLNTNKNSSGQAPAPSGTLRTGTNPLNYLIPD